MKRPTIGSLNKGLHVNTWVLEGPTSLSGILIFGPALGSFSPFRIGSPLPCWPSAQSPPVSRMDNKILWFKEHHYSRARSIHHWKNFCWCHYVAVGRHSSPVVSTLVCCISGSRFRTCWDHCVVFLSKTIGSHNASLHPGPSCWKAD